MKKILNFVYSVLAAAMFVFVMFYHLIVHGSSVQMFKSIGDRLGFTWIILTTIFYWSWKLLTKYHPDFQPKTTA